MKFILINLLFLISFNLADNINNNIEQISYDLKITVNEMHEKNLNKKQTFMEYYHTFTKQIFDIIYKLSPLWDKGSEIIINYFTRILKIINNKIYLVIIIGFFYYKIHKHNGINLQTII